MQKRGVTESSTLDIIKLCFNSSGYADAVGAQLDRAGKVINPRQAVMRQGMDAIERCPWVDTTKGLTKHEMRDREAKAMAQRAVIGTDDPHAFNFREPIPTTVEDDRSYSSSVVTESKSLAEFSTFVMERGDTVYHCEAPTKTAATENEDWEGFWEEEDWTTDEVGVAGFIDMSLLTTTGRRSTPPWRMKGEGKGSKICEVACCITGLHPPNRLWNRSPGWMLELTNWGQS